VPRRFWASAVSAFQAVHSVSSSGVRMAGIATVSSFQRHAPAAVTGLIQRLGSTCDGHPVTDQQPEHLAEAGGLDRVHVQHHTRPVVGSGTAR
jgi:hypothetical protein